MSSAPPTTWRLLPEAYALVGFSDPPDGSDLSLVADPGGATAGQLVREGGETTLLVPRRHLGGLLERHPEARVEDHLRWIRFDAAMDWEVVGFLARVTSALAEAGVPLGAVCGYSRDSLFVAEPHLPAARAVLARLFPEGERPAGGE